MDRKAGVKVVRNWVSKLMQCKRKFRYIRATLKVAGVLEKNTLKKTKNHSLTVVAKQIQAKKVF